MFFTFELFGFEKQVFVFDVNIFFGASSFKPITTKQENRKKRYFKSCNRFLLLMAAGHGYIRDLVQKTEHINQ